MGLESFHSEDRSIRFYTYIRLLILCFTCACVKSVKFHKRTSSLVSWPYIVPSTRTHESLFCVRLPIVSRFSELGESRNRPQTGVRKTAPPGLVNACSYILHESFFAGLARVTPITAASSPCRGRISLLAKQPSQDQVEWMTQTGYSYEDPSSPLVHCFSRMCDGTPESGIMDL